MQQVKPFAPGDESPVGGTIPYRPVVELQFVAHP
jgi:hypothetical protein